MIHHKDDTRKTQTDGQNNRVGKTVREQVDLGEAGERWVSNKGKWWREPEGDREHFTENTEMPETVLITKCETPQVIQRET